MTLRTRFSIEQLRPDLGEDLYRLEIAQSGDPHLWPPRAFYLRSDGLRELQDLISTMLADRTDVLRRVAS